MPEFGAITIEISGTVHDRATGETLPQANVYFSDEKGNHSGSGTAADNDGKYTLSGPSGYVTASYTGYQKQTKPAASSLNFRLEPGAMLKQVEIIARDPRIMVFGALLILGLVLVLTMIYKRYVK